MPEADRQTTRAGRCGVLAPSWWLSPGNTEAGGVYSAGMKGNGRKSYQGPQRSKRRTQEAVAGAAAAAATRSTSNSDSSSSSSTKVALGFLRFLLTAYT